MKIPDNSKVLLEEISSYIKELPQPINQLFLLELYKLYTQHKIDYTVNTVINEFAATHQDTK